MGDFGFLKPEMREHALVIGVAKQGAHVHPSACDEGIVFCLSLTGGGPPKVPQICDLFTPACSPLVELVVDE